MDTNGYSIAINHMCNTVIQTATNSWYFSVLLGAMVTFECHYSCNVVNQDLNQVKSLTALRPPCCWDPLVFGMPVLCLSPPAVYPDGCETVSVWQEGEVCDLQLQLPV